MPTRTAVLRSRCQTRTCEALISQQAWESFFTKRLGRQVTLQNSLRKTSDLLSFLSCFSCISRAISCTGFYSVLLHFFTNLNAFLASFFCSISSNKCKEIKVVFLAREL